uniref:Solute carrier family 5 member 2 n=1 Tax=Lepisosteus oculatus TaxID=7918 RepID=W5M062_LEPOC
LSLFEVGASLFASNIGSGHFVGLAGTGAASGIAVGGFEWNALFIVLLLGWLFVPVYLTAGVSYLERLMNMDRLMLKETSAALTRYALVKLSLSTDQTLYWLYWSLNWGTRITLELKKHLSLPTSHWLPWSHIDTTLQKGIQRADCKYPSARKEHLVFTTNELSSRGRQSKSRHLRLGKRLRHLGRAVQKCFMCLSHLDLSLDFPVTDSLIAGVPCTAQVIVQRCLAARSLTHVKAGCIMCGYLKLLPMFLMVFPGMISRVLYPDEVACVVPEVCKQVCGTEVGCSNIAYPKLVVSVMPNGETTCRIKRYLTVLITSNSSGFGHGSVLDQAAGQRRSHPCSPPLAVSLRVWVLVIVSVSIAWIPVVQAAQSGQLFDYIQSITSYLAPPIAAVFFLAVFVKRVNEPGAFWGLLGGLGMGLCRMVPEFVFGTGSCLFPSHCPPVVCGVHYLYFAVLLFFATATLVLTISYCTQAIPDKHVSPD